MMENQFCQNTRILMFILSTQLSREAVLDASSKIVERTVQNILLEDMVIMSFLQSCVYWAPRYIESFSTYDKCDTFMRCTSFCSYLSVRLRVLLWNRFKMLVLNIMLNLYSNLQSFLQSSLQLSSRAGVIEQKKYIKPSEVT